MKKLPAGISKLQSRLRKDLAAEVDVEPLESGSSFLITVFSKKFKGLPHLKRQDLVWSIADATCSREETLMISLIFTYAPGEIEAFVEGLGA